MLKQLKSVFKDSVIYGLGSLLPKAAGFLLVPIYTRYMDRSQYGILSMSGIVASAMGSLYMLGLNGSVTRFFRGATSEDELKEVRSMLFTVVAASMVLGGVLLGLTLLVGPWAFPRIVKDARFTFTPFVAVAVWGAFLGGPTVLWQAVARAQRKSTRFVKVQVGNFAVNTLASLALVVGFGMGALGSLWGTLIAAAVFLPLSLWFLRRDMEFRWSWPSLWKAMAFGLPLVPHYFAGWILSFADRYLLERYTSLAQVGIYSLAYNVAMVTSFVAMAVNQAWTPIYYDVVESEERATLPRLTTIYASAVAMFCALFLLVSRGLLVALSAPAFHAAASVVPIVVAAYFMQAMYFVTATPLFYEKKTNLIPLISAFAGVVNICINLVLIPGRGPVPALGIYGAAWATFAAFALMAFLSWRASSSVRKGSFESGRLLRVVAAFGVAWMLDAVIARVFVSPLDWRAIVARALALVFSIALFLVFRIVTRREIESFIKAVVRKRRLSAAAIEATELAEVDADGQSPDDMDIS